MDLFMPAERVLYDRAYYLSDEAEKDYASEVAEEHGIDVGKVLSSRAPAARMPSRIARSTASWT